MSMTPRETFFTNHKTNDILNEHFRKEMRLHLVWEEQERQRKEVLLKRMEEWRKNAEDKLRQRQTENDNITGHQDGNMTTRNSSPRRSRNVKESMPDNSRYIGWGVGELSPKYRNIEQNFQSVHGRPNVSPFGKRRSQFFDRDGIACLSPRGKNLYSSYNRV